MSSQTLSLILKTLIKLTNKNKLIWERVSERGWKCVVGGFDYTIVEKFKPDLSYNIIVIEHDRDGSALAYCVSYADEAFLYCKDLIRLIEDTSLCEGVGLDERALHNLKILHMSPSDNP